MNKLEMLELAAENARYNNAGKKWRKISHPNHPDDHYTPHLILRMKQMDGSWTPGIVYINSAGETFCRAANNFEKFSEVQDA